MTDAEKAIMKALREGLRAIASDAIDHCEFVEEIVAGPNCVAFEGVINLEELAKLIAEEMKRSVTID